ncbi:MAG: SAVED domain-containing protein [Promethearchaeota archaeon]|jgi:hypothetical protein
MKKRDIHKLIADSGGRCNFPGCGEKVIYEYEDDTFVKIVEFCHIIGESSRGPRGHPSKSELMKKDPENIILLCANHHKIIDNNVDEFSVDTLKKMKISHTQWVNERLDGLKEAVWTLILHSGNITGTGAPNLDKELISQDFYGTHVIEETEELVFEEFLTKTKNWDKLKKKQEEWWEEFKKMQEKPKKYIICSINFIPLVIQLGYLIHNTNTFDIYQYHSDENTWKWKLLKKEEAKQEFFNQELFEDKDTSITEIALSISITGVVNEDDILEVIGNDIEIIKISVDNPNRTWLKYKEQLLEFQKKFTWIIDLVVQLCPALKKIHLFFAGPPPIAFIIGSYLNPTIHPEFILYNYFVKDSPRYTRVFEIN